MSKTKLILFLLPIFFSVFLFVYGGYDDSPGAQGLGALSVLFGIVTIIQNKKQSSTK